MVTVVNGNEETSNLPIEVEHLGFDDPRDGDVMFRNVFGNDKRNDVSNGKWVLAGKSCLATLMICCRSSLAGSVCNQRPQRIPMSSKAATTTVKLGTMKEEVLVKPLMQADRVWCLVDVVDDDVSVCGRGLKGRDEKVTELPRCLTMCPLLRGSSRLYLRPREAFHSFEAVLMACQIFHFCLFPLGIDTHTHTTLSVTLSTWPS